MAKAPTLTDVVNIFTGGPTINANNDRVVEAFQNTLSRDGSTPNQMEADLDMNSNDLLNVNDLDVSGDFYLRGSPVMVNDPGLTKDWATNPEDVQVDPEDFPGEYSAFHYMKKAEQYANEAAVSANRADFNDISSMLASSYSIPVGTIVITRKEGYSYLVVSSGPDLTTAGGVLLQVVPDGDGNFSVGAFNPIGNGIANDTVAFQSWASRQETLRLTQGINLIIPPKRYLITSPIIIKRPGGTGIGPATLTWDNATLVCGFNRQANPAFLIFGDPATPGTSSAVIHTSGKVWIEGDTTVTGNTPIAIRCYVQGQSLIEGIRVRNWWNTVLDLKRVQNVTIDNTIIYGGGYSFGYRDASASQFRRTGTTLTRVSGAFNFQASDVGKTVSLLLTDYTLNGVIQSVIDPANVVMNADFAGTDGADRTLLFSSPAPKIAIGSPTVILDGPVTAQMVGLPIMIPRGDANGKTLFAEIIAANPGTSTITLNKNAGATLNPDSFPLASTSEIASPVILIDSEPDVSSTTISQVRFNNTQIETFRGTALGVNDAEFVDILSCKLHGVSTSNMSWDTYALAAMWGNRFSGRFIGEFDQLMLGQYRLRFADQTQIFTFMDLKARMRRYEKLLRMELQAPDFEGAVINFGTFAPLNIANGQPFSALVDDVTTGTRGVIPPLHYLRGQYDDAIFSLGPGVYADRVGNLTFGSPETFFTPTIEDTSGTLGSGTLLGSYTRIGRLVHLRIRCTAISTAGLSGAGNLYVGNLPFAMATTGRNISTAAVRYSGITTNGNLVASLSDGATRISLYRDNGSGTGMVELPVSAVTSGSGQLIFEITYFCVA